MRILLDTHILLWALTNDPHLCEHARELILDERNEIYYSILSLWETELKRLARPDVITERIVKVLHEGRLHEVAASGTAYCCAGKSQA